MLIGLSTSFSRSFFYCFLISSPKSPNCFATLLFFMGSSPKTSTRMMSSSFESGGAGAPSASLLPRSSSFSSLLSLLSCIGVSFSYSLCPASFSSLSARYSFIFTFALSIHFLPSSVFANSSYIPFLQHSRCGLLGTTPDLSLLQPSHSSVYPNSSKCLFLIYAPYGISTSR